MDLCGVFRCNYLGEKLSSVERSSSLNYKYQSIKWAVWKQGGAIGPKPPEAAHSCRRWVCPAVPASGSCCWSLLSVQKPCCTQPLWRAPTSSLQWKKTRKQWTRQLTGKGAPQHVDTWEASWRLKRSNNCLEENSHSVPMLSLDIITAFFIIIFFQPWQKKFQKISYWWKASQRILLWWCATIVELGRPLLRLCSDSLNIQILGMPVPLPVRIEILMNANMNKILMNVNMNPS